MIFLKDSLRLFISRVTHIQLELLTPATVSATAQQVE